MNSRDRFGQRGPGAGVKGSGWDEALIERRGSPPNSVLVSATVEKSHRHPSQAYWVTGRIPSGKRAGRQGAAARPTREYAGCTECVLPERHCGDHEDEEGVCWPDEDAIY